MDKRTPEILAVFQKCHASVTQAVKDAKARSEKALDTEADKACSAADHFINSLEKGDLASASEALDAMRGRIGFEELVHAGTSLLLGGEPITGEVVVPPAVIVPPPYVSPPRPLKPDKVEKVEPKKKR